MTLPASENPNPNDTVDIHRLVAYLLKQVSTLAYPKQPPGVADVIQIIKTTLSTTLSSELETLRQE